MASHAGNVSIWWRHHVWSHHMERHVVDGIGSDKTGRCWKIPENLLIIHESFRTIHLIFYLRITGFRNIYTQWWSNCIRRHGMVERYLYIYVCVGVCIFDCWYVAVCKQYIFVFFFLQLHGHFYSIDNLCFQVSEFCLTTCLVSKFFCRPISPTSPRAVSKWKRNRETFYLWFHLMIRSI